MKGASGSRPSEGCVELINSLGLARSAKPNEEGSGRKPTTTGAKSNSGRNKDNEMDDKEDEEDDDEDKEEDEVKIGSDEDKENAGTNGWGGRQGVGLPNPGDSTAGARVNFFGKITGGGGYIANEDDDDNKENDDDDEDNKEDEEDDNEDGVEKENENARLDGMYGGARMV